MNTTFYIQLHLINELEYCIFQSAHDSYFLPQRFACHFCACLLVFFSSFFFAFRLHFDDSQYYSSSMFKENIKRT